MAGGNYGTGTERGSHFSAAFCCSSYIQRAHSRECAMQPDEYCLLSDERLLELCSDCDSSGRTLLHLAAQWTQLDLVSRLLKIAPHTVLRLRDSRGRTPLIAAAVRHKGSRSHVEILEMLWKACDSEERAVRDSRGRNVMHWWAARLRGTGAVRALTAVLGEVPEELLMRKDSDGNTALHCLARAGHSGLNDYGLEQVASGRAVSSTALFAAFLLECAPRAERELNNEGRTPLMECIIKRDFIAAGVLLSGATVEGLCALDKDHRSILYHLFPFPSFMRACLAHIGEDMLLALPWRRALFETSVITLTAMLREFPSVMETVIASVEDDDLCDEKSCRRLLMVTLKWGRLDLAANLLRRSHPTLHTRFYAEVLAILTMPYDRNFIESVKTVVDIVEDAPDEVFSDGTVAVRACRSLSPLVLRAILQRSPPEGPFRQRSSGLIPQFSSPQNYVILAEELAEDVLVAVPLLHLLVLHPLLKMDVWRTVIDTLPPKALLVKDLLTGDTVAHCCAAHLDTGDRGALLLSVLLQAAPELRHQTNNKGCVPMDFARSRRLEDSSPLFQVLQGMTKRAAGAN